MASTVIIIGAERQWSHHTENACAAMFMHVEMKLLVLRCRLHASTIIAMGVLFQTLDSDCIALC